MSSPALPFEPAIEPVRAFEPEQRLHRRYQIALDAEYEVLDRGLVTRLQPARTINISKGGLLLECKDSVKLGSRIEVSIHWPFLLNGFCPLNLLVRGRTVRAAGSVIAIRISRYQFRTAGRGARNLSRSTNSQREAAQSI